MHCFRRKASAFTAIVACMLLFATSCHKIEDLNLTPEELDSINAHSIDYALQVIPDIHEVIPIGLLKAMDAIVPIDTTINGHDTIIYKSALHFGDNPPVWFKKLGIDTLGFAAREMVVAYYYQSDTTKPYILDSGTIRKYTNYFRFYDQHRGIAKYDFKCSYIDMGPNDYICETSHVFDSVFIMGSGDKFTAYLTQKRTKEHSAIYDPDKPGEREAVIISGELTSSGIKNFYFAMEIIGYDNPTDAGERYPNIHDIIIFKSPDDNLPFTSWDPYQYH